MSKKRVRPLVKTLLSVAVAGALLLVVFAVVFIIIGYNSARKPVSYIPGIEINGDKAKNESSHSLDLKGQGYILSVKDDGKLIVRSAAGDTIISNLVYYSSDTGIGDKLGLDSLTTSLTSDSTISVTGKGLSDALINYVLTVSKTGPGLKIEAKSRYRSDAVVHREAMLIQFAVPVSEVFKKNRQTDTKVFEPEYWLQKQGVLFGRGDKSALIYNTTDVSSLQLETKKQLLVVNLDYYMDHPFVHIPFQADGGSRWVDRSDARFSAGTGRSNSFTLMFGNKVPADVPRFMLVPGGYLAGYVFTEHADGGKIRTQRAAYFGSEDITRADEATGGFVGHKVPVTKSIFYTDAGGPEGSSIKDDTAWPEYLDFLDQLNETGLYDICLHTPDGENSTRKILEESISFMKNRFDTKTWIDHGMYSGRINRECMSADGLDPKSDYYAADLWQQYGTQYFWSPAPEMIRNYSLKEKVKRLKFREVSYNLWKRYLSPEELAKEGFFQALNNMVQRYKEKGELNSLLSYKSEAFPTPLYWQHPTESRNLYSWVTDYEKETNKLNDKKIGIELKLLDKLDSDWGVFIDHGYFVRNGPEDGNMTMKNGKLITNPYFDKILDLMAQKRDAGDLWLTTVRDLMDYWLSLEKITFDYTTPGEIHIINSNDHPVVGLSLAIKAGTVRIDGETPKSRRVGENTIFWFDLPANQSVTMVIGQ